MCNQEPHRALADDDGVAAEKASEFTAGPDHGAKRLRQQDMVFVTVVWQRHRCRVIGDKVFR